MEKRAELESQLKVDEAILDYLLYAAIKTLLEQIQSSISTNNTNPTSPTSVELALELVDSFLIMFRYMHPHRPRSADLQFRLRLLKFTTLSASRFAPSPATPSPPMLQSMRKRHYRQAKASPLYNDLPDAVFSSVLANETPLSQATEEGNFNEEPLPLDAVSSPPVHTRCGELPTLLDTLPDFMAVSAAQIMLQATQITDVWMRLAVGYMSHSFAEQVLVYRRSGPEILRQAFAWGFDANSGAEEGSDELQINAMFLGEDGVVGGWEDLREAHIRALIPSAETSLHAHLDTLLANDLPITVFEQHLLDFLWGLLDGQPKPVLAQVESEKIHDRTRKEMQSLKT